MKTSARSGALVAFISEQLGQQLISGRGLDRDLGLLPFSKLTLDASKNIQKEQVLLFERSEDVTAYLEEGSAFDFASHIVSFADATRRLQSAL